MQKLTTKKEINKISVLFALTYMVSYISRINYGAVLSEMEAATQMQKTLLSMAVTGSFVTYGAGQVVTGICGDWFSWQLNLQIWLGVTLFGMCVSLFLQKPWKNINKELS